MNTKALLNSIMMLALGAGLWLIPPPSFATFPGANGKIAFTRNPGNQNLQIYVMNHDGSGQTDLTNNTNYCESNPVWSPDGTKLAFASNYNGNFDIWVMNADGTDRTNLTKTPADSEGEPAWSPDGTRIAFYRRTGGGVANLWIMDAEGNDLCQRTFNSYDAFGADWSPDGSQIAFTQSLTNTRTEIYLVNPNCSEQPQITQITNEGINSMSPSWSPDGTKIVFARGPAGSSDIWVMKDDGSNQTNRSPNPNPSSINQSPGWSPDGTQIVFESYYGGRYQIFVMNGDGTNPHNISNSSKNDNLPDWGAEVNQPPVANAGLNLTITSEQQSGTIIQGTATDPDHDSLTYRWLEDQAELLGSTPVGANGEANLNLGNLPVSLTVGTHTLTLEVSDGKGTDTDDMLLTIDNSAPHVAPTGGGTYQISAPITVGGEVSDFDNDPLAYSWHEGVTQYCAGSVQAPANSLSGTPIPLPGCALPALGLGDHTVTLMVSDGINSPVSSNITITVIDSTAPTLSPEPDKSILWPPNHKMVNVTIDTHASDNSGPPTLSAIVSSNEPQNGLGDGDTAPDWTTPVINQATGVITLQLRAERSGSGNGRVYTVTITATDASGNTSTAPVNILVPHDKGK